MSNSYIVNPEEGRKDDTLILMVNDNGVISVDQDTLQNLISMYYMYYSMYHINK
jgi:hypothetical protein